MAVLSRRLTDRFGLQARMTASYVLVTAAAVVVVEAIAIGVLLPNFLAGQDLTNRVIYTAGDQAERVALASTSSTDVSLPRGFTLGDPSSSIGPGQVSDNGQGLVIPQVTQAFDANAPPMTVALVITTDGTILASSYPARYPVGASMVDRLPVGGNTIGIGLKGATTDTPNGRVTWAVQPVLIQLGKNRGVVPPGSVKANAVPDAYVYVQAPVQPLTFGSATDTKPLFTAGLIVLLLALPVGALFGFVTTRGTVKRLRRLAATTARVADGDFSQRVSPGAGDEVGRLESNFNEMTERLAGAVSRERALADNNARQTERNRISRDLHDSISQDLFSISLLAAGLEKALPRNSPVRSEIRMLVETAETTNREMRALLLELRPAALEDKGLIGALEELASTYAARLGVKVDADLESLRLEPAGELAALRIAQEGLANAVRHAHATTIKLGLHQRDGNVEVTVSDDGQGFGPTTNGAVEGMGLRMMRERVEELGGSLTITSEPGAGTMVSASIPNDVT
jgi:signal transduction histidine kinase